MMLASSSLLSGSAMARRSVVAAPVQRRALVIQNAHKMGAGSTKNGRNSNAQRRGIKVFGGQPVKAGGIIFRQVGTTWHDGTNTALGKDFTVFSLVDGVVVYDKKKDRPVVHVYPFDSVKGQAAMTATHTKKPKEGVPSRQERRKALYKPRNPEKAALAVATVAASVKP